MEKLAIKEILQNIINNKIWGAVSSYYNAAYEPRHLKASFIVSVLDIDIKDIESINDIFGVCKINAQDIPIIQSILKKDYDYPSIIIDNAGVGIDSGDDTATGDEYIKTIVIAMILDTHFNFNTISNDVLEYCYEFLSEEDLLIFHLNIAKKKYKEAIKKLDPQIGNDIGLFVNRLSDAISFLQTDVNHPLYDKLYCY